MAQKTKPERNDQTAEPTPESGELRIWRDEDGKVWKLYRDPTAGNVRVESD